MCIFVTLVFKMYTLFYCIMIDSTKAPCKSEFYHPNNWTSIEIFISNYLEAVTTSDTMIGRIG